MATFAHCFAGMSLNTVLTLSHKEQAGQGYTPDFTEQLEPEDLKKGLRF